MNKKSLDFTADKIDEFNYRKIRPNKFDVKT